MYRLRIAGGKISLTLHMELQSSSKFPESFQKRFEDFVIFLFLASFYLEKCKFFFAEVM